METDQVPNKGSGSYEEKDSSVGIQRKQEQQTEWLEKLVTQAPQLIDRYLTNSKQKDEARERRLNLISKHNRRLTYSLLIALSVIIGIMAILTYLNKVSGDALLFLVGTITGYVLFMIQNLTIPMFDEGEENE